MKAKKAGARLVSLLVVLLLSWTLYAVLISVAVGITVPDAANYAMSKLPTVFVGIGIYALVTSIECKVMRRTE